MPPLLNGRFLEKVWVMGISKCTFPWAGVVPFSTNGCGGSRRTRGSKKAQRQTTLKKHFLARRDADFVRQTQISSIKFRYSSVFAIVTEFHVVVSRSVRHDERATREEAVNDQRALGWGFPDDAGEGRGWM